MKVKSKRTLKKYWMPEKSNLESKEKCFTQKSLLDKAVSKMKLANTIQIPGPSIKVSSKTCSRTTHLLRTRRRNHMDRIQRGNNSNNRIYISPWLIENYLLDYNKIVIMILWGNRQMYHHLIIGRDSKGVERPRWRKEKVLAVVSRKIR